MSIATQIERLQSVRKQINNKLTALELENTEQTYQGIADTLDTVTKQDKVIDKLSVSKTSVSIPKGLYNEESAVSIELEEKTVIENGDVTPTEGKVLSKVVVNVPAKTINLQDKTVNPNETNQEVSADSGYDGLGTVTITAIQTETKTVTENGTVTPTEGKYLKSVIVDVPEKIVSLQDKTVTPTAIAQTIQADDTYDGLGTVTVSGDTDLVADNIKKDIEIFGVTGTYEGSGSGGIDIYKWISNIDQNIVIPNTITIIRQDAFKNYTNLSNVEIPNTVTQIDGNAFYGCNNLALTSLPESITWIGTAAFYNCVGITLTKLPDNFRHISSQAFYNCKQLALTELPTNTNFTIIENSSFSQCTNLKITKIPDNIKTMYNYAFSGCTNMPLIELSNNQSTVPAYAFEQCKSLTVNIIPDSVTKIDNKAFAGCTGITSMYIPSTCTTIASPYGIIMSSFIDCTNLTDIYTDATEALSGWGAYWNYTSSTTQATVHYGVSKEHYQEIINGGATE